MVVGLSTFVFGLVLTQVVTNFSIEHPEEVEGTTIHIRGPTVPLKGHIGNYRKINTINTFRYLFLDFVLYGSWDAQDSIKMMPYS